MVSLYENEVEQNKGYDIEFLLDNLHENPIIEILSYPNNSYEITKNRLISLEKMGVCKIFFIGRLKIRKLNILGKGTNSIVLKTMTKRGVSAVKIMRPDSNRDTFYHEVDMLRIANKLNIGPKVMNFTKDIILMEYISGDTISETLMKEIERPGNKGTKNLMQIFRNVFDQCLKLDREGLDHGEINRPDKHIIINNKMEIKILDFESSSINRRVTNVTSIGHFLFIGGPLSSIICERFLIYDKEFLFQVFTNYKNSLDRKIIDDFLHLLSDNIGLNLE